MDEEFPKPYILNIPGKPIPTWVVQTPKGIRYFQDGESAHDFWIISKNKNGKPSSP